ncbi:hypothetical protein [Alteromonas sp. D210916BOD_24]|uniref:hypothetical protein n=1 Tax=Alteromonas sp. D210916BOD_24 TaxID=3157618 RepID=UPI00399D2D22
MNIVKVFKDSVSSLLNNSEQEVSEKLIQLATFFYKVDRRVSLEEQKYMDDLLETIEWNSPIDADYYQRTCISEINNLLDRSEDQIYAYLSKLMLDLSDLGAAEKAKILAKEISDSDGEIADDEVRYLEYILSFSQ